MCGISIVDILTPKVFISIKIYIDIESHIMNATLIPAFSFLSAASNFYKRKSIYLLTT